MKKAEFSRQEFNSFIFDKSFDFIEIDPFGSPTPFIYNAVRSFRRLKKGFLSATATDAAVLCGAHPKACLKNYGAKPLNNEMCHEVGARIMLGKIARDAAEFNLGIVPLLTISRQHFFKTIARLEFGDEKAFESARNAHGYLFQCTECLSYWSSLKPFQKKCAECGSGSVNWAGPLWAGEIHDAKTLDKMMELNKKRGLEGSGKLGELLLVMKGEAGFPPGFIDLHALAELKKESPKPMGAFIEGLEKKGMKACRTHFRPTGVKLDALMKKA